MINYRNNQSGDFCSVDDWTRHFDRAKHERQ